MPFVEAIKTPVILQLERHIVESSASTGQKPAATMSATLKLQLFIIRSLRLVVENVTGQTCTVNSAQLLPDFSTLSSPSTSSPAYLHGRACGSAGVTMAADETLVGGLGAASVSVSTPSVDDVMSNNSINTVQTELMSVDKQSPLYPFFSKTPNAHVDALTTPIEPHLSHSLIFGTVFQLLCKLSNNQHNYSQGILSPAELLDMNIDSNWKLFNEFQKIVYDLHVRGSTSVFFKYFKKTSSPSVWTIKDDCELADDQLWTSISRCITTVFNTMTPHLSRHNLPTSKRSGLKKGASNHSYSLPQQLKQKLQSISKESDLREQVGYYTIPSHPVSPLQDTLPSLNENSDQLPFNLLEDNAHLTLAPKSSLEEQTATETLDDHGVEELLKIPMGSYCQLNISDLNNDPMSTMFYSSAPTNSAYAKDPSDTASQVVYQNLIETKDSRIKQLEKDLESQKQEVNWLRKLLIEDMGYLRSGLQTLQSS